MTIPDHTKGLACFMRGFAKQAGSALDLLALREVSLASSEVRKIEGLCAVRLMRLDEPLCFGAITVILFRTSHDAAASWRLSLRERRRRCLGLCDWTPGVVTEEAHEALLERTASSRSRPIMMRRCCGTAPYPYALKRRVGGDFGHLSNDQAAAELERLLSNRLEHVVGMHLSENNNLPRSRVASSGRFLSATTIRIPRFRGTGHGGNPSLIPARRRVVPCSGGADAPRWGRSAWREATGRATGPRRTRRIAAGFIASRRIRPSRLASACAFGSLAGGRRR